MKSDNEVRNGRVHRKEVGAGEEMYPSRAKRGRFFVAVLKTLYMYCATMNI